jgi:hypothetical protein
MVTGLDRLARSTRAIKRRDRGGEALADIVPQLQRQRGDDFTAAIAIVTLLTHDSACRCARPAWRPTSALPTSRSPDL